MHAATSQPRRKPTVETCVGNTAKLRPQASVLAPRPCTYCKRTASGAAGNGLYTTIKCMRHEHHKLPSCRAASFEVNSEPHTGARPSVRLCVGPELARCVHKLQDRQEGLMPLTQETYAAIIAAVSASDLSAAFLDHCAYFSDIYIRDMSKKKIKIFSD